MISVLRILSVFFATAILVGCSSYSGKSASNDGQYGNRLPATCKTAFSKMRIKR